MCFVMVFFIFRSQMSLVISCVVFYSLTKDMTGKEDVYRGPAIRALCRITDVSAASFNFFIALSPHVQLYLVLSCKERGKHPKYFIKFFSSDRSNVWWFFFSCAQTTMLQAIERYMKQAIVDKVPSVSSSALVSSLVNKCLTFIICS